MDDGWNECTKGATSRIYDMLCSIFDGQVDEEVCIRDENYDDSRIDMSVHMRVDYISNVQLYHECVVVLDLIGEDESTVLQGASSTRERLVKGRTMVIGTGTNELLTTSASGSRQIVYVRTTTTDVETTSQVEMDSTEY